MPKNQRKIKIPSDKIPDTIEALLEAHFWLPSLETMTSYERLHDDHDGTREGTLCVMFSPDGDARVWIEGSEDTPSSSLRFRMPGQGGGLSRYTRVALLILAEAIRRDNLEIPH